MNIKKISLISGFICVLVIFIGVFSGAFASPAVSVESIQPQCPICDQFFSFDLSPPVTPTCRQNQYQDPNCIKACLDSYTYEALQGISDAQLECNQYCGWKADVVSYIYLQFNDIVSPHYHDSNWLTQELSDTNNYYDCIMQQTQDNFVAKLAQFRAECLSCMQECCVDY